MASELIVQNLKGPAGGSNPNTIILPAGHTLDTSGGTLVPSVGQILQVDARYFSNSTGSGANQTYVQCAGSTITLTAKGDNSRFLVSVILNVYTSSNNNGINAGIYRNSTLVGGTAGAAGDSWQGANNNSDSGSVANKSNTLSRTIWDMPGITAGTTVQYTAGLGRWTAGSATVNYPGYYTRSSISVMEIAQ